MANRKVALLIRVKLADGSRPYLKPVVSANGKVKPLYALVNGKPEHHPEGVYALRFQEGKRAVYEQVGSDPAAALAAKQRKETLLRAQADGYTVIESEPPRAKRAERATPKIEKRPVAETIDRYLNEVSATKSHRTFQSSRRTLNLLLECCQRRYLEDIDRPDLLAYMLHLRSKGNGPRTVANRVERLKSFFLSQKLAWPLLKTDKPRYTEKLVLAYSRVDITQIMSAANAEEYELYQFFLCTGAREQEVSYACWSDINFFERSFSIREKPDLKFRVKDCEERTVPIPDSLVELLRARRERYPRSRLIFPRANGKPDGHFLRTLKILAFRAGLNCGDCHNRSGLCCRVKPICSKFGLHKFRKTYATWHHEAGVPVRRIQLWLGHSNLETTLRYLAGSDDRSQRTRELVNNTFAEFDKSSQIHKQTSAA